MTGSRTTPAPPSAGDFDSLYNGYRAKVYRVILRLVQNPSDAEDLTQETFLKVQKHPPTSGARRLSHPGCTGSQPIPPWISSASRRPAVR